MSAFIVSKTHIDSILTAALAYRVEGLTRETATDRGRELWLANVASVAHRYPQDREHNEAARRIAEVYVHRQVTVPGIVKAAKLIDSLDYQCCELDIWCGSPEHAFLNTIREALLRALPGYESAAWTLEGPE